MKKSAPLSLWMMMFLQYSVWGVWLPTTALYLVSDPSKGGLGFSGLQMGTILGLAGSIGALTSPFFGQIADRYFNSERTLAVLLILGGVIKWVTAGQTTFVPWLWLSIAYSVVFMPTLALTNSIALAHLHDSKRQFPLVRVWGTLGWIAASWVFPMIWLQKGLHFTSLPPFLVGDDVPDATARLVDALRVSAAISWGYAIFCLLFLPRTPPRADAVEPWAFAKAFGLLRRRSFLVVFLAALPVAAIHQIYFLQTSPFLESVGLLKNQIGPAMSVGQFSEILFMAALGWGLKRLGFRVVVFTGAAAYFVRYFIWSFVDLPVSMLVVSQALHGICYACFFAATYIYVDRIAPPDVRHSAQTVYAILILGFGPIVGGWLSGYLQELFTVDKAVDFSRLWLALSIIALATALFFVAAFRDETRDREEGKGEEGEEEDRDG